MMIRREKRPGCPLNCERRQQCIYRKGLATFNLFLLFIPAFSILIRHTEHTLLNYPYWSSASIPVAAGVAAIELVTLFGKRAWIREINAKSACKRGEGGSNE